MTSHNKLSKITGIIFPYCRTTCYVIWRQPYRDNGQLSLHVNTKAQPGSSNRSNYIALSDVGDVIPLYPGYSSTYLPVTLAGALSMTCSFRSAQSTVSRLMSWKLLIGWLTYSLGLSMALMWSTSHESSWSSNLKRREGGGNTPFF